MQLPYFTRRIRSYDFVSIAFLALITLLAVIFHRRVSEWWFIVLTNTIVSPLIVLLAVRYHDAARGTVTRFVRDWYPVVVVVYSFQVVGHMAYPIRGRDYDEILIAIDRWLFGLDPTEWIAQFHHPALTEILVLAYASYYFLFLIAGYELYRRKLHKEFGYFILLIVYGFYLSYIGYLLVPAVGPRFMLHDFHTMYDEMPGLLLADTIRELLNRGESIPAGVPNPRDYVHRDVFPSGHTQLTLILMYAVWLYRLRCRRFIYVVGSLLIVSTVYLWYHYVIDLIAAVGFVAATVGTAPLLERWWDKKAADARPDRI
jgi:membrane-associated phospholipid phosphatase